MIVPFCRRERQEKGKNLAHSVEPGVWVKTRKSLAEAATSNCSPSK
jgi:hypothetical protein